MKLTRTSSLALAVSIAIVSVCIAQEDGPHIGYVYPAGGQQGTTFEVLLGGQHLGGAAVARVSGSGVTTEVIEHIRPLNQGAFKELQNRMGKLTKNKANAESPWTADDDAMLAEIRKRLKTFSIRRSSVPALVETVTLQVTIAADARPGQRELRLQTELGLTNPMVFCVGQLRELVEKSGREVAIEESEKRGGRGRKRQSSNRPDPGTSPTSNEPERDTEITLPATLNGQILPGDVDRYRFRARKGQHIVVDVAARKLIPYLSDAVPGWFQATVSLLDANGHDVVFDDDFRFHPDPVLHCEIPNDGEYVIKIRDALYRGREDFVYRIDAGELPFVMDVFPLGCQVGAETTFSLNGWNLPQTEFTRAFSQTGRPSIAVSQGGLISNQVRLSVDDRQEHLESEPNNSPADAQTVNLPSIVNGRIDTPGDIDVFRIQCRLATEIVVEVFARRLGSSLDSIVKVTDDEGRQLALNDDFEDKTAGLTTHHADSRIRVRIPQTGFYCVYVGDSQQQGGVECSYRLHLGPSQPDFELRVVPSSVNARAGTTVPITVHAVRKDGFDGDVLLDLRGAPAGFALGGAWIPAGQNVVRVTLSVPSETMNPVSLSLAGRAMIQRRTVTHTAVAADDVMQAFIYRHLVPAKEFQVAVTEGSRRSQEMRLVSSCPVRIPVSGTVHVPVVIPIRSFFGAIQLELSDPPAGLSIQSVRPGQQASLIVLRSDPRQIERGLKGNLIVNVFAAKMGEDSGKGKEQRKKRRVLLSALPAIPFEVASK